jgi:hypothetical protein
MWKSLEGKKKSNDFRMLHFSENIHEHIHGTYESQNYIEHKV